MSSDVPNTEGQGWRLWTHVLAGPHLTIAVNPCHTAQAHVTIPIPLELARRIASVPEIKLVTAPRMPSPLLPHWLLLVEKMLAAGMTSERKASGIASLYADQRTPKPMRGAAVALWRRGLLGRVPVQSGSHYWVTEQGLALLDQS